ncbi:MAG: DNA primase [Nitrosopumilus sp.]|nr:DNA primase [Nitrosopumilus sp.]
MLELGEDEKAKYPFMADAGKYLKEQGFTLEQFGTDPDLIPIVEKAYTRIHAACEMNKDYESEIIQNQVSNTGSLPREVFSFLLSIVLLKLTGIPTLARRFALSESMRAEGFLTKDLKNISSDENELPIKIIEDLFSIKIKKQDDFFIIPVIDYIKHSIHFHEREWKLVNRHVENGFVYLKADKMVRLFRIELGKYINSKISSGKKPSMIPGFEDIVERLIKYSKKFQSSFVTTGEYPPCIKHAIEVLEKGENLPHSGRFMLATFLLSKEQSIEQIAPLFKNAPDYNERVTLYQLNHLAGTSGSGTQYSCPSCEKLNTQSLCFATSECDNIINPLQFGKKRK